jgi:hypothetical protein
LTRDLTGAAAGRRSPEPIPDFWRHHLWRQFGAAIDMLRAAIESCPDDVWADSAVPPRWRDDDIVGFWYIAFHTLFWLDRYLAGAPEDFAPPSPFTLDELDPSGLLPERAYSKAELLDYLSHCRQRCRQAISDLTPERAAAPCPVGSGTLTFGELMLYNLRHVQHHVGQLNLVLRQRTRDAPGWRVAAPEPLGGGRE